MGKNKSTINVLSDEDHQQTERTYVQCAGNISEIGRVLGISRQAAQNRVQRANRAGYIKTYEATPNDSAVSPFKEIREKRLKEFSRQKRAGNWRKVRPVKLAHNEPYCIIFIGDPHLDNPGTDIELFEKWTSRLDASRNIYGFGLGDWLDEWLRVLSFLYAKSETTAPEGHEMLRHYLGQIGPHMIGSVSGNHDDWSAALDFIMREAGVINHRKHAVRIGIKSKNGRMVTVGARHRFPGHSQWNTVHGIMKAAKMGWRDHILVGGDKHISGDAKVKDPDTGFITHCYQVAAFKIYDDYSEEKGFLDHHISPAIACVVDPSKKDDDPSLIEPFYCPDAAILYLEALLARKSNA